MISFTKLQKQPYIFRDKSLNRGRGISIRIMVTSGRVEVGRVYKGQAVGNGPKAAPIYWQ